MDARQLAQDASDRATAMIREGADRCAILTHLATSAERASRPGVTISILVIDSDGLLRNGASPNLPDDYLDKIDRLKPDANVGTCAAAAATGAIVMTPDFLADHKWAELRHLPLALGYAGAWSMPIKAEDGRVLGTFGTYYREKSEPSAAEREAIAILAAAAAKAIAAR